MPIFVIFVSAGVSFDDVFFLWVSFKQKWNSAITICPKYFLRNIAVWNYLQGKGFSKIGYTFKWLFYSWTRFSINNIYRRKNRILFWRVRQDHGRFEINLFLIFYKIYKITRVVHKRISTIKINWQYSKNENLSKTVRL